MRYAVWSRGRLLGHTDLDLDTHQSRFIHGFIEPTPLGERVLPDATGVVAVCARRPDGAREGGLAYENYLQEFRTAVDRREALDLVLRDANGGTFDCDFIRVYDLRAHAAAEPDPLDDDDLDEDAEEDDDGDEGEMDDLEAELAEDLALREESRMYGSAWDPPEDERWQTMQYYVQVFLNVPDDEPDF